MKSKTYILTKISRPGFTLTTNYISIIERILDGEICSGCKIDSDQSTLIGPKTYYGTLLSNREKLYNSVGYGTVMLREKNERKMEIINGLIVDVLLGTSCGCEYQLELENEDIATDEARAEYMTQRDEDFDEYNKLIKGGICNA